MSHKMNADGVTRFWGAFQGALPTKASDGTHIASESYAVSLLKEQADAMAAAGTLASDVLYIVVPSPSTAAEWAAEPALLKVAADDIATNGSDSAFYSQFAAFMADDATFPVQLENVDSYTSVDADKVMNLRLVDIYREDAAGTRHGLTFMAKHALPCAVRLNGTYPTSYGYPSQSIRTDLNSGFLWNMLPTVWQNVVSTTTIKSFDAVQVTSEDKLFPPSWYELCGSDSSRKTNDGPQFAWFATKGTTSSAVQSTLVNMYQTNSGADPSGMYASYRAFWTRSRDPATSYMVTISPTGDASANSQINKYSILPCLSVG